MTARATASIEERLAELGREAPRQLAERVFVRFAIVPSLAGDLWVAWTETGICAVQASRVGTIEGFLEDVRRRFGRPLSEAASLPAGLVEAARSGRGGQLRFDLSGLSPFEVEVLEATSGIPLGEVRPYAWVAAAIGRPRAVRAVGSALGRNPVPILIPCHRVTRSDGSLGQYGGGGTEMKKELLEAEQVNVDEVLDLARRRIHYVGCTTTKVVCFPSCRGLRRSATRNRRGFASLADAEEAGFRPCTHCRPGLLRSA